MDEDVGIAIIAFFGMWIVFGVGSLAIEALLR